MEALLEEAAQKHSDFVRVRALYNRLVVDFGRRQVNCAVHGPYFETIVHVPTRCETRYSPCTACLHLAQEVKRKFKAQEEARAQRRALEARLRDAELPRRFAGRGLSAFSVEVPEQRVVFNIAETFVETFLKYRNSGCSLVFAGSPGTGKTLLAAMIVHDLCCRGFGSRYTTCHGLVSAVRNTWGAAGEGRQCDVLDSFASPSLLVIDEIGVQAGTDSEKAILFDIIDRRYSEKRPTIFVTNLDAPGLHEFFGDRTWDRLTEIVRWVAFSWESQRPKARALEFAG